MYWKRYVELIDINDPVKEIIRAEAEKAAMNYFIYTVRRADDSRYEVFYEKKTIILYPLIFTLQKILDSLIKKLDKDGYRVFLEWLEEGIIKEVFKEDCQYRGYYLPHRHVIKLSSATAILRLFFDVSARQNVQIPSMNQCLEKGINFIELIPFVLICFRQHKYGVILDIKKHFFKLV